MRHKNDRVFSVHDSVNVILLLLFLFTGSINSTVHAQDEDTTDWNWQRKPTHGPTATPTETTGVLLRWHPPQLEDPVTLHVTDESDEDFHLENDVDYIFQLDDEPINHVIRIYGGRNIVMIGGEINIPYQGKEPTITERTGLKINDHEQTETRIVHIEGLLIRGEDLSEGINIDAPNAIVQIQNVRIEDIHARDQVNFTDNHPDLIQPYGNVRELRVDHFTGSTDYQGFLLKSDYHGSLGTVKISNVNIIGNPTSRYLVWFDNVPDAGDVTLENFWLSLPEGQYGEISNAVWPPAHGSYPNQAQVINREGTNCVIWSPEMRPYVKGYICEGTPETGDFVKAGTVGIGYTTPGYADGTP